MYKDPLGVNATGKKNRTSGLESMDMKSSTGIDYAPELSVISTGAPDKDNQKLRDKVDMVWRN